MAEFETCSLNPHKHTHEETASIHLHPSNDYSSPSTTSSSWSLHARVHLESKSTLTSPSPLFHADDNIHLHPITTVTPFSQDILQLISKHKLHRLLIQIGDRATSSSFSGNNINDPPNSMGPAGTYISASFLSDTNENNDVETHKIQYATLLRYLIDNSLLPACGGPLDSIRERKHGHSIIVHPPRSAAKNALNIVNVEANLAADGSSFCSPDFIIQSAWGASSCHTSDNWGLFDSLFAPPVDSDASTTSSSALLSDLLLGSSSDSFDGDGYDDARHSVWMEVHASPECFTMFQLMCTVEVNRGVSYRIALPSPTVIEDDKTVTTDGYFTLPITLGDLLLGHDTLEQSVAREGWKAWYPCPLSDSSKIHVYMPNGYEVLIGDTPSSGMVEIDTAEWKDDYLDLVEPWAQIYRVDGYKTEFTAIEPVFGIARTIQRPLGIAGPGTLVTVVRVGENTPAASVRVDSLDVLPGHLMRPKMPTMRMVLFQGGGAGSANFVPIGGYDSDTCLIDRQCGMYNRTTLVMADLQNYNITSHTDGTVYLERSVDLAPDSSIWMMVDYDEAYLPFQKFPADANRGVDIFPSCATFTPITSSQEPSITLYSPSLLVLPPVPDMSMPFNVISLSCTLWAFVLGSMINILVRRSTESVRRELTGEKEKRPIDKLKEKLCEKGAKVKALFKRLKVTVATKTSEHGRTDGEIVDEKKDN
ncbi:hypothetical protein ACHAXN_004418 [Cyclotella atomus]